MTNMTTASVSRSTPYGLPPALKTAQAAMQLPEVQDMLRRLSEFRLGIFMPHQHDDGTGEFQPLPDDVMQVESGRTVSFERQDEIAQRAASFLPVAWLWRAGAPNVAAVCEMADQEGPEDEEHPVKHKHPENIR
ncbi:hypothetical protein ASE11_14915 [Hydrogenophaga sp. Root209]|uniref:hypothetical protein n=1 Tax=Hydrogenophaga sp. Root209 TaxID=1736490 RepID=UPI0006F33153|nr:hypothetical protein [Hydrogenophaga sp. Root209]KRB96717.1 hypothetical protein ASE11_14915 [Hydrogenophaga sp. Root209]MDP3833529.1 hypothetical protein [Hydrogenophaga sp.]